MITAAALLFPNGLFVSMPQPARHHHIINCLSNEGVASAEQGFVDEHGRFYDRISAAKHAVACGQIEAPAHPPNLYSEDLW